MTQAIQIRVEEDLKRNAEVVLNNLGLDMPSAIRIFLTKVVSTNSIPFELKNSTHTVNGFTPEFEAEVLRAEADTEDMGSFDNAEDLIATLHKSVK